MGYDLQMDSVANETPDDRSRCGVPFGAKWARWSGMTKPFAIYLRQSRDLSGIGLAIERQLGDCHDLATRLGLEGQEVLYVDNDITASNTKKRRPGYEALMAAIRAGEHDILLCWHNDRLHRRPAELEEFISVVEASDLAIRTVQAGTIDLSTPTGRLVARIVGAVARQEVEHKGQRQRAALRQKAMAGNAVGSRRRFGYGRDIELDGRRRSVGIHELNEREAVAVRVAFERIKAGEAPSTIWHGWNDEGLFTARGHAWTSSSFSKMMQRESLAGLVVYRGQVLDGVEAAWPAIVDLETFYAVQALMGPLSRYRRTPWRGLCDGIVTCEYCREPMRIHIRPSSRAGVAPDAVYLCRAKARRYHVMIMRHLVDEAVLERSVQMLARRRASIPAGAFLSLHPSERPALHVAARSFGKGYVAAQDAVNALGLNQRRALVRVLFDVAVRKTRERPRVLIMAKRA